MKIDLKKLFIKYLTPSFLLILGFVGYTYFTTGYIAPFGGLFFIALLFMFVFWALLEYFQNLTGILMKESWVSRIIFILVALVLFYLYRINGRI
ncbi:MAG: hypothetical protein RR523_15265 [Cetobacterium sp.]|uniref:hypothetical protein n=1 Tax=Cetobacterium sp. TaxID=2071632 RepID=UPI002FCB032D